MAGVPVDSESSSESSSGYEDGLGRRVLAFDRETGGLLERLVLRPELSAFEQALKDRIAIVGSLEDERFTCPRTIERDADNRLAVVSECVAGRRLSDLLEAAGEHGIVAGLDAGLGLLLELLPAISRIHDAGLAHGALAPGRVMVTPAGQMVLLDSIYGDVLERLKLTRRRLWSEFRLAFPPTAGIARFDKAADLSHAIMIAATLTVGRPLGDEDYPEGLAALRTEILEIASIRGSKSFAESVDRFFSSYLPITPRRTPLSSADEAAIELRKLVRKELGITVCRSALLDFFQQVDAADGERAAAEAIELEARIRAAAERATQMEAQARIDAEYRERERQAERRERERLEDERREQERQEAERRERERLDAERLDAERRERERLDAELRERDRLEAEGRERERLEAERREQDRLEAERRERERFEAERRERERLEAERRERERLEAERERERLEAERLVAERRERERLEAERRERERLEAERRERERLEAERVEAERRERERLEAERRERERLEAERRERERLEAERRERERLEAERREAERRERERLEAERRERERLERERAEKARLEAERLEAERRERERLEAERRERERLELERAEKARLEAERREKERQEAERLERERAEKARIEAERAEKARLEAERIQRERQEAERRERERLEAERREKERQEAERLERERAEKARIEAERAEKARLEAERAERERQAAEQRERERKDAERRERERQEALERERAEKARLEAERAEREHQAAEQRERERKDAEQRERERKDAERREREQQEALERERAEKARLEAERAERERQAAEKRERERKEAEKRERERKEAEKRERERKEALERERAEKARLEAERAERERQAAEQRDRERKDAERRERELKEALERERAERARLEAERAERDRQEAERRGRERAEADRRERERRERQEQDAYAAAAPPPPSSNGWLVPPDRAAAFSPPVQEAQRPAQTPRAYPVYHPPSQGGAWNADVPPPTQAIQIAPVAAATPPIPFQPPAPSPGPTSIRLKDDVTVRPASPKRIERRLEEEMAAGPVYAEPAVEGRQLPWKMIAAAVVVIVGTIAVTKSGVLGSKAAPVVEKVRSVVPNPSVDSAPPTPIPSNAGRVTITSEPAGARVLLDGKAAGETPLTLDSVPPGKRTFTIIGPGGSTKRTLRVEAGKSHTIEVGLYSGFAAFSAPLVLDVSENGKALGTTAEQIMLTPGRHDLRLANKDLGYAVTQSVDVQAGEVTHVDLDPRGTANINAAPWAEVYIDGVKAGETPLANVPIRLGVRDLVFRNPQFPDKKVTITVTATATASVTIDFNK